MIHERRLAAKAKAKSETVSPRLSDNRRVAEGVVTAVLTNGRVRVTLAGRHQTECRCAHAVDLEWLRAAVEVAPVEAECTLAPDGRASLIAVFAGDEHQGILPPRIQLSASDGVHIECGTAAVRLEKDGKVQLRGKNVITRGSRTNRVQGGSVRLG